MGIDLVTLASILKSIVSIGNLFKSTDRTGMGKHPKSIDDDIPEPEFKERLVAVGESLADDLRSIDIKTNWSTKNFTPLDAEVEIIKVSGKKKRKITDLLNAIRKSKDQLFLVLGDPGSGKSVSLRKLCQDLTKEIKKTGKIPIYINLKEWNIVEEWNDNNPPTVEHLEEFIKTNLKSRDIVISKFFDKYYDRLYESGRLFFVLDSFDEMPAVLNEKENSDLIRKLSNVLFKFLKGARSNESQGILASRIFRKPTIEFQSKTTLEIRPFSEEKIIQALHKSGTYNKNLIRKLFKERSDLVPIARNPFCMSLLSDYAENNNYELPKNQSDLYESYINNTFKSCSEKIEKNKITQIHLHEGSIEIAHQMFTNNLGFEASINTLKTLLPQYDINAIIDILRFSRIGRVGTGDNNQFSFSHRRFCEYFAIQKKIKDGNINEEIISIPQDSQWRDALVLYCEVAEKSKVIEIARFCWDTIKKHQDINNIESIHCLRFLNDAFKGRLDCIAEFRDQLGDLILKKINAQSEMIVVKFSVDTLGLLDEQKKENGILAALNIKNSWLNESAFKSCRHLPKLGDDLERKIISYVENINPLIFLRDWKKLNFSLTLSQGLQKVQKLGRWRYLSMIFSIITFLLIFTLFMPYSIFISFFVIALFITVLPTRFLGNPEAFFFALCSYIYIALIRIMPLFLFLLFINHRYDIISVEGVSLDIYSTIDFAFSYVPDLLIVPIILVLVLVFALVCNSISFYYLVHLHLFFRRKEIKKILIYISENIISIVVTIVLTLGFGLLLLMIPFIYYTILISVGIYVLFLMYNELKKLHICSKYYKEIQFGRLNDRAYINEVYNQLIKSPYHCNKFIRHIEINIREAKGEWLNPLFLQAGDNNFKVRLAKLDLRWKRLDN